MLEDHFRCPQCDYDLHGLADGGCPECGFRYDLPALKALSRARQRDRESVAREMGFYGRLGSVMVAPAFLMAVGLNSSVSFILVYMLHVAVFVIMLARDRIDWVMNDQVMGHPGQRFGGPLILLLPFAMVASAVCFTTFLGPVLAFIVLLVGWLVRLIDWNRLPSVVDPKSDEARRALIDARRGTCWLVAGTVMLLVAFAAIA